MYDLGRTHSILFMVDGIWIWMHMFTLKEIRWRNECGVECDWWSCAPVSVCSDLIGCCAQGVYWTSWGGVASVVSRPSWSHWSFIIRSSSRSWPDNSRLSAAPSCWVSMSYSSMLLVLFLICFWTYYIIISCGANANLLLSEYWFSEHTNSNVTRNRIYYFWNFSCYLEFLTFVYLICNPGIICILCNMCILQYILQRYDTMINEQIKIKWVYVETKYIFV